MPNTGKTTTLNLVWNMLLNNSGVSSNRQTLGGDPNDFSDIVNRYKKLIAFYTMGDYSTYLANAVTYYNNLGCDVLVCALSVNNAKIRANNTINQFSNTRINKTLAINQVTEHHANSTDALTIFNLL